MVKKILSVIKRQRSAVTYTSGAVFNSIAQIISNIIILSTINPDELGLWNSLLLFETYTLFLQAGVINGLNRELPFYLGKNDEKFAHSLASSALYFFLLSMGLCLMVGIGFLFYNYEKSTIFKLTFGGILIVTTNKFYENYLASTFRSNHAFEQLARIYFFRGVLLIVSTLLVFYFGYNGYVLRMVLISLSVSFMMHIIRPIKCKPIFNLSNILILLKVGAPIFVLSYIFASSITIDRVILINYAGIATVGNYSLGLMAFNAFNILPSSLANYIYPKMSFAFGKTNDAKALMKKAFHVNLIVFCIMLPIAITGYILLPILIPFLFPKYISGINAAQILLLAAVFTGSSIGVNVLWSLKIWKYMVICQLGGAFFNVVLIFVNYKIFKDPILGVSFGVLTSQFCYFILTNYLIYLIGKNERYSS